MANARSFVILPDSTVSIHTSSSLWQNSINSRLLSNLPRKANPRVHAKIDAIGLVDVGLPCCRYGLAVE